MNRILITGGAGFLGSHLCEKLLSEGNEVICLDNYYTGRKKNISKLMDYASFELIRHDVTFPIYLEVDQIYNMACPASPIHSRKTQYKLPRPAFMVPLICWDWQNVPALKSCKHQRVKFMETRKYTHKLSHTGAE